MLIGHSITEISGLAGVMPSLDPVTLFLRLLSTTYLTTRFA